MDNMILKYSKDKLHDNHLTRVFNQVQQYIMKLNPKKCTIMVEADELLGFYLIKRGIKANPDKYDAIIKIKTSTTKKKILKLNGMLTAFNRFI